MLNISQIDQALSQFEQQINSARSKAEGRLGRKPKLGELSLPEDLHKEMLPVLRQIYQSRDLRRSFFGPTKIGRTMRLILLAFMSELIYWEYETSFWRVCYAAFEEGDRWGDYNWFTTQMQRGFKEQGIPLIVTYQGRQFVRTILLQSGFSREMVKDMRKFIVWFFERTPDLDPRSLDTYSFEEMLAEYDLPGWEDLIDLLREMIWDVSRLLRVIRKKALISTDLRDPEVIEALAAELGFHPIKDIFGFRDEKDIQELLEILSARINPKRLYSYLIKRAASHPGDLRIILPTGETAKEISPETIPLMYGVYRLEPDDRNVYVVPRESITYARFEAMVRKSPGGFHRDGPSYVYMHDRQSFTVLSGSQTEPAPLPYAIDRSGGYFWYGRQRIGIPLRAYRGEKPLTRLEPFLATTFSPWLRLTTDRDGLEVVIPSFTFYVPEHANATCRLEVNSTPISEDFYLIDENGFLQLQGVRTFPISAMSQEIGVCLQGVDDDNTLAGAPIDMLLEDALLFSGKTGESIRPGNFHQGEHKLYLLVGKRGDFQTEPAIPVHDMGKSGDFQFYQLEWAFEETRALKIAAGSSTWLFQKAFQIDLQLKINGANPHFKSLDVNSAFSTSDIKLDLLFSGDPEEIEGALDDLTLIVDKDDEFISDFSLNELEKNRWMADIGTMTDPYQLFIEEVIAGLIEANLTDTAIGSWRFFVGRRTPETRDVEIFSQAEFLILPELELAVRDEIASEGEETLLSVHCDHSFLADFEERPASTIQIPYIPALSLSIGDERLKAGKVEKTIRLYYPPTRVKVVHKPEMVFGMRVVEEKVLPGIDGFIVDARFLKTSRLYVRGTPEGELILDTGSKQLGYQFDEKGNAKIPLSILREGVKHRIWDLSLEHMGHQRHFTIRWEPAFKFKPEECGWRSSSNGPLELAFEVDGPAEEVIEIRLMDSSGSMLLRQSYRIAELTPRALTIEPEPGSISQSGQLYCTAFLEGKPLDMIGLQQEGVQTDPRDLIAADIEVQLISLAEKSHEELMQLLRITDLLGFNRFRDPILKEMFSIRTLDQIYDAAKADCLEQDYAQEYFHQFRRETSGQFKKMPLVNLKKYSIMPCPPMVAACSEALLALNDGVGVDHVIEDLLLPGHISFEEGVQILNVNHECSSEILRDILDFDALERETEDHIDLIMHLSKIFHPAASRKARALKDWKRACDLMEAEEVIFCDVTDWISLGVRVTLGVIGGDVPLRELDGENYGLGKSRGAVSDRLHKLLHKSIPLVVTKVDRKNGTLILSNTKARKLLLDQFFHEAKVGDVREGMVTGNVGTGIFVDLNGVSGFVHGSELQPKQDYMYLKWGDRINVRIVNIDHPKKRINLKII